MIVDVHVHVFPSMKQTAGYRDIQSNYAVHQGKIRRLWGRMKTNTLDERYIPEPDEDVGFRMDDYGKFYWTKHGKECWMQRFPAVLKNMEWTPEQMIAFMDEVGVDKGVIQSGYMEMNFERDYMAEVTKKWPDRFIGTVTLDYDVEKGTEHLKGEMAKLRRAAANQAIRGVYQVFPRGQAIESSDFDPLWKALSDLGLPHFFFVGFQPKDRYMHSLKQIEKVLKKFPDLIGIIGHLGGNVRSSSHPNYTDGSELLPVLRLPNAYFEVGYVLAYENWTFWKENYEYPYPLHTKLIKMIHDDVGCERLLWGSDMPNLYRTCTYRQCLDLVRLHFDFLDDDEKNLILGGNAAEVFRLEL
jgi:predicted TIM-barrel fold metal-dependent hydrolase